MLINAPPAGRGEAFRRDDYGCCVSDGKFKGELGRSIIRAYWEAQSCKRCIFYSFLGRFTIFNGKGRLKFKFQTAFSFAQTLFFRQAQDGDDESAPNDDQCDKHHDNG